MSHFKYSLNAIFIVLMWVSGNSPKALTSINENPALEKQIVNAGLIIFPPFIQQKENNKCFGSAVDDLQKIFPADTYTLNIHCASPLRIYRDFNEGFIDLTINVKTTISLESNVLYSRLPYRELEIVLYSRDIEKPYSIAAIRAFSYSGTRKALVDKGYTFVDLSTTKDAIAVFLRGGTDAILSYRRPFEHYLDESFKNKGFGSLNLSFKQEYLASTPTFFAINRRNEQADELLKKINDYFDEPHK